jgi:protein-disulfide isomerase
MSKQNQSLGIIFAIIFSSTVISGALVFFGMKMSSSNQNAGISPDMLSEQINKGIQNFIDKQQEDQQAQANEQQEQAQILAQNVKPVSKEKDHIRGNPNAKITLIEYSDIECPFCKRFHGTAKQVMEEYGDQVNWVYRHFPLAFHDPLASKEAEATECVSEIAGNDAFWIYIDSLYENTTSNGKGLTNNQLTEFAVQAGADKNKFNSCLSSNKYAALVKQDLEEGSKAGVSGTPGNIILNNETGKAVSLSGAYPFESFKEVIYPML